MIVISYTIHPDGTLQNTRPDGGVDTRSPGSYDYTEFMRLMFEGQILPLYVHPAVWRQDIPVFEIGLT